MPWDSATFLLSALLAASVPLAIGFAFYNRIATRKGVGWQFMRCIALTTALPIIGVLALNGMLTSEVATLIAAAMGFAFGKTEGENDA